LKPLETDKKDEAISMKQDEPKFEWQRKINAPKDEYTKTNGNNQDKKLDADVKPIKCIKCKRWGHLNTDKACPMYGKSRLDVDTDYQPIDSQVLAKSMAESDGLVLKSSLLPMSRKDLASVNANIEEEDEKKEDNIDIQITLEDLKNLSKRDKKFFLERLERLTKIKTENKSSKKRKDSSSSESSSSSTSSSDSEDDCDRDKRKKKKKKSKRKHKKNKKE
jgi:CBF1 interacting corepressor